MSIVFCKRSLATKSDCYQAHYLWGRNLVIKQENEKATRKFKKLFIANPEDWRIYFNLGELSEREGKLFEAETQYKKSLSLHLSDIAYHNLILVLIRQCKLQEALEQSEKNIQSYPKDALAYNNLGCVKFILGNYKEAIKSFEVAIQKGIQSDLNCLGQIEMAIQEFWKKFEDARMRDLDRNLENLKVYMKENWAILRKS